MKILVGKAGSGKSSLFQRICSASYEDGVQIKCLFGRDVSETCGFDWSKTPDTDKFVRVPVKERDLSKGLTIWYHGEFHFIDSKNTTIRQEEDAQIDLNDEPSFFWEPPYVTDDATQVYVEDGRIQFVSINFLFDAVADREWADISTLYPPYVGVEYITATGQRFYGFDLRVLQPTFPLRQFDGVPYIHIGEGTASLSTRYRCLKPKSIGFNILGGLSVCVVDSITADIYSQDNSSALKGGLPSSVITMLARHNISDVILIYTPVFGDDKDPLTSFNQVGYTSGDIYVKTSHAIRTVEDLSSINKDDVCMTTRVVLNERVVNGVATHELVNSRGILYRLKSHLSDGDRVDKDQRPWDFSGYKRLQDIFNNIEVSNQSNDRKNEISLNF